MNAAKAHIQQALQQFQQGSLRQNALNLLATLGYESDRQIELDDKDLFLDSFDRDNIFRPERALFADWRRLELLCQLTDTEIRQSEQMVLFDSAGKVVDHSIIESYLFMAVALRGAAYTRSQLAQVTREVNRLFKMPVMLLFRHGDALTISIINRRLHRRDSSKDVLEKVTLIKDIRLANPHRAHVEILFDLSLAELHRVHGLANFVELHQAWQKTLDISELNKRFFKEIANWYFWAVDQVAFPPDAGPEETRSATSVIRLITRLIFVWFLKEKGLVPDALFNRRALDNLLIWDDPQESAYYKAILQNLFFATLNQEMNSEARPDTRKFRHSREKGQSQHYMIHNLYRYERYFADPAAALALFANIPFLNGGLFECLDRKGEDGVIRVDAFSDRPDNPLRVPDDLFFGDPRPVDLNETYGTRGKTYKAEGLIRILNRYKFTVAENTPIEEEIALDPELLGKVFENLLAAYNPETGTTARKQTGSFYTPRAIVDYMVDESLVAYLAAWVARASSPPTPKDEEENDEQDARATFFDPLGPLDIYQRDLPHWRQEGVTCFVTFRLGDSLPQEKLQQLRDEREAWLKKHKEPYTPAEKADYHRLFSQRVEDWLDAGMGSCLLGDPENGRIVADALRFFDGRRYRLGEWVVMPNHCHVLVTPLPGYKLEDILHSWKSFTANKINQRVGRSGSLWQEESYDRIIRDEAHLRRVEQYIADNPRKAGSGMGFQPVIRGEQDARATVEGRLRHLLAYNEDPPQFDQAEKEALIAAINQAKILDPACGSGAFPMGVLHKLVFILGKLDPDNQGWRALQMEKAMEETKGAYQLGDRREREERLLQINDIFERNASDYGRKLYLIENCIYGVDIQPIAVQIAKLRFFISLVVDQRINDDDPNRGVLPLPNLETKFVAANTLLGIEKSQQMGLRNPAIAAKEKELAETRSRHFRARTPATKEKWRLEDKRLRGEIGGLLQNDGFPNEVTTQLANWDPYNQNAAADFFDPEWMYGLTSGFDMIIGNPPYVRQEKIKELKPALQRQYSCFTGVADLYVYFFEGGYNLLRENGVLTYISSNKYFRAGYGRKLRAFLAKQTTVRQLLDFGDAPVFAAIAYPSIIVLQKKPPQQNRLIAFNWRPEWELAEFGERLAAERFKMAQAALTGDGWQLEQPETLALLEKLRRAGKPLGEYVNGRFYRGIVTGLNQAFVVDKATRDRLVTEHSSSSKILKPFLRGRDVKKWQIEKTDLFICYVSWDLAIEEYPAVYAHLKQFKTQLQKRPEVKEKRYPWYTMSRYASNYWQEFEEAKIVLPAIAQEVSYAADFEGHYTNDKTSIAVSNSIYFLLGILNSRLGWWVIKQTAASKQGGFFEFKPMYVTEIPIVDTVDKRPIEELVEKILAIKQANPAADVTALEQQIDAHVYALYNLTPTEIALIEGRDPPADSDPSSGQAAAEAVTANAVMINAAASAPLLFTGQPPQGSFGERLKHLQALSKKPAPSAIQELVAALSDENLTIRWLAATTLEQLASRDGSQAAQVAGVLQAFLAYTDSALGQAEAEKLLGKLLPE